jgi:hypothetical protein
MREERPRDLLRRVELFYFTGAVGLSERPFVAVLPAKGDLAWVCPGSRKRGRVADSVLAPRRTWRRRQPYA